MTIENDKSDNNGLDQFLLFDSHMIILATKYQTMHIEIPLVPGIIITDRNPS